MERNAHRLHVVAACLKLDDAPCHKDLDLALPRLPPPPSCPQPKVAAVLSDLLGEGRFSQSVRLPHNYFIGMGLYMSFFCLTSYLFFSGKRLGVYCGSLCGQHWPWSCSSWVWVFTPWLPSACSQHLPASFLMCQMAVMVLPTSQGPCDLQMRPYRSHPD